MLELDPNGPDLDPDDARAGDVISNSLWDGLWGDESPESNAAAATQARLGDIARQLRNARGNRSSG